MRGEGRSRTVGAKDEALRLFAVTPNTISVWTGRVSDVGRRSEKMIAAREIGIALSPVPTERKPLCWDGAGELLCGATRSGSSASGGLPDRKAGCRHERGVRRPCPVGKGQAVARAGVR